MGTHLRGLGADHDVATVAALLHNDIVFTEDLLHTVMPVFPSSR